MAALAARAVNGRVDVEIRVVAVHDCLPSHTSAQKSQPMALTAVRRSRCFEGGLLRAHHLNMTAAWGWGCVIESSMQWVPLIACWYHGLIRPGLCHRPGLTVTPQAVEGGGDLVPARGGEVAAGVGRQDVQPPGLDGGH
mgnify:CR=1 FL=1